ncbi:hypothetical protein BSLG_008927 [Batrachochytrium salamandrivorans]|nr:hypothetical protein BSLG_008927 [Batrachochytrium salamandrivorans]
MKPHFSPTAYLHNFGSFKKPAKTTTKPTTTASKKDPKKQKSTQSLAGEASQTIVKDVAEELKKIQEELIIERRERNYFQLERERKNGQINALMKNHDKAFTEIKNYYNDITLNNLALINSLKKQLTWEHEVLEQRFSQVQNERDELYENFVDRIISVQQKTGFKNLILEKKVDSLKENLEKKELQVNEIIKATNLDPTALESLTNRLEDVLNAKNRYIKDLQYDLAKVTKAHNDMIHVYEAKLTEFSIPVEELGFKPLMVSTKAVSKPAGLALSQ